MPEEALEEGQHPQRWGKPIEKAVGPRGREAPETAEDQVAAVKEQALLGGRVADSRTSSGRPRRTPRVEDGGRERGRRARMSVSRLSRKEGRAGKAFMGGDNKGS